MKIKILAICLLITLGFTKTLAQDTTSKTREIYLSVINLAPLNIGIKYKTQIDWNTFFKVGLINLSYVQNYNGTNTRSTNYAGGVELGIEFRKNLLDRLTFYHGPNISLVSNGTVSKVTDPITHRVSTSGSYTYTGSVPYTLGLLFNLGKHFLLSAELNPAVSYSGRANSSTHTISAGLSNSGLVSLVYRL